jgi:hypothetical protein
MTIHTMRTGLFVAAVSAALLGFVAAPAGAQTDFGLRAGAYLENSDPFVGLELLTRMGSSDWFFNPNVEFVFADQRDRITGNFDFHYDFRVTGDYYLWAGAGPAILYTDGDGARDSETDAGLNLLAGIGWRLSNLTPYAQVKVVVSDDSELVAAVGVRF